MDPDPTSPQDIDHRLPSSGSSFCFVCSKSYECDIFCNNDLRDRFLNFCVEYLKVGIDDVLRLKGRTGEGEKIVPFFCKACERFVQETLKVFRVFNDAKSRLLGKVNQLGLMISQRAKGDTVDDIVESFIKQVESQCK